MSFDSPLPPYNASDPNATFLSSSCLDLLMIELVPMAYRIVQSIDQPGGSGPASASAQDANATLTSSSNPATTPHPPASQTQSLSSTHGTAASSSGGGAGAGALTEEQEQEERDAVFYRLEMLGYRVGQGLVERFSKDRPRFTDTLDVIKFLCKDLWMLVWRKQIDNLKTNHRGVYVLTDNNFKPLGRMSTEAGGMAVVRAQPYLWFPCGIIRGALASMGINATVQAETIDLPGATFQIKSVDVKT